MGDLVVIGLGVRTAEELADGKLKFLRGAVLFNLWMSDHLSP